MFISATGLTTELKQLPPVHFPVHNERGTAIRKKKPKAEPELPQMKDDPDARFKPSYQKIVPIEDFDIENINAYRDADEIYQAHPQYWNIAKRLITGTCKTPDGKQITPRMLTFFAYTYSLHFNVPLPPVEDRHGVWQSQTLSGKRDELVAKYSKRVFGESKRGWRCMYNDVITAPCQLLWLAHVIDSGIYQACVERYESVKQFQTIGRNNTMNENAGDGGVGEDGERKRKRRNCPKRVQHTSLTISPLGVTIFDDGTVHHHPRPSVPEVPQQAPQQVPQHALQQVPQIPQTAVPIDIEKKRQGTKRKAAVPPADRPATNRRRTGLTVKGVPDT